MRENPRAWHLSGHPAPTAASSSTKTNSGQTPRTPRIYRGNISRQKRCNPQWHTFGHRPSLATATFEQNGSPQDLPTDESGKKPRRSSAAPQSSDILYAEFPSSPESSKSITMAGPTRSRAPAPPPHPPRHSGSRRSKETASPSLILLAVNPAALPRADPATAPAPARAAPESAQAIARCVCRTGTPRQRKTTPARAGPFRPCTHSPAKSSPSSSVLRTLCYFSVSSVCFSSCSSVNPQPLAAFFPSSVITLPRSFTTPFSAPAGIRIISSNKPVIAVKNSSMLSIRSRVYASPRGSAFTSCTHSASTCSVGSISRRFRSSETIRKISHTSLMDSKWSRRSPSTCTTRTIRHPCSSRKLVLTFERATASVAEISSAGTGRGDRNSSACTCATVRLIPHRVPISPQCKMNFCATGVKAFCVIFVLSLISVYTEYTVLPAACQVLPSPSPSVLPWLSQIRTRLR